MEFRDYMIALAAKIREVSTNRVDLDPLKWVTETTAELHGDARWLHAQPTENTLVALSVYTHGSIVAYQNFRDDLTDPHIDARAKEIAPLLDAVSDMSDADES
jgi:hypothetical protein